MQKTLKFLHSESERLNIELHANTLYLKLFDENEHETNEEYIQSKNDRMRIEDRIAEVKECLTEFT